MNGLSNREFNELLHESASDLYRIAYGILGNSSDSENAVSETVYRTYKNRRKIREPQYLKTWMVRVLINVSRDMLKKSRQYIEFDESYMIEPPKEEFNYVHDYVDKLPTELRELIVLKYIMEYTYKEISEIKQQPQSTLKSKVIKALQLLRVEMEELYDE